MNGKLLQGRPICMQLLDWLISGLVSFSRKCDWPMRRSLRIPLGGGGGSVSSMPCKLAPTTSASTFSLEVPATKTHPSWECLSKIGSVYLFFSTNQKYRHQRLPKITFRNFTGTSNCLHVGVPLTPCGLELTTSSRGDRRACSREVRQHLSTQSDLRF